MAEEGGPPAMQEVDLNDKDEDDDLFGQVSWVIERCAGKHNS